ncbi:MAG: biotin carboxylase, partial [Leptospiraceae bacterium]|nr:biotin carboxylase [Leptospiraceae bacterium]
MFDNKNRNIKFHESDSEWIKSFSLNSIKCLIVCRGPVRKEAMDVFDEIGVKEYGILLSEKDSVVYPMALAPELRGFKYINNIHRVPDYMGAGGEERVQRMNEIIGIAKSNGYTHIFAGYGFMAEDAEFIEAIEKAGITFMGPGSHVAKQAGAKDEAKKIARKLNVSVTPGVDNISALALLKKAPGKDGLIKLAKEKNLNFNYDDSLELEDNSENLLQSAYDATIDLISIEDLQNEAYAQTEEIWKKHPENRIRLKYIGGGGGKGQRVIRQLSEVKAAVMEIIAESKVVSEGSNRNFLIELNIENTRHNEIQLIGNGEWSLSLGGRDCSLQMHEQKLLELSYTVELFENELKDPSISKEKKKTLEEDLETLKRMEEESERFGKHVRLDSVSTFELIVEGTNHFFMEMNTRIQVEHRVTEMAYKLKISNPDNPSEYFILESLIEAMALLSVHGKRVPKPERILRNIAGGEARINATNQSLQPHAGGLIQTWSDPVEHEIRDDQGIGVKNPDTGMFIHYRLAGAYDSNIALLVSYAHSRKEILERLSHIIKVTELRGHDLQTNMPVHYGLINWILGKDPMFKPNTRFMLSYLAGVGSLASVIRDIDLDLVWKLSSKKIITSNPESAKLLNRKLTLITRPIKLLLESPHVLGGFIGFHEGYSWKVNAGKIEFVRNPIHILNELYNYLDLEANPKKPACDQIWDHDADILNEALSFYADLEDITGLKKDFKFWDDALTGNKNPDSSKISDDIWKKCVESHKAYQVGLDLLKIIPGIGEKSGFNDIGIDKELNAVVPEEFTNSTKIEQYVKALNPPPKAKSDEIVAPMGGMFYSKEAPNLPAMIQEGESFKAGQPLFIIEVMKMFNKISAPFSGTIVKNFLQDSDGKIVTKGQTIF